ncbi:penicillin amidase [Chitinophaga skermanii]|uniref:Penicillin amidase n=1 Tax=Chitinophaga skermanii TaxID=331697 RepID=A0A327QZM0_9BACT|nr:penicillin acylase family protein [Chitinophaga skermanii]RAJ08893.1 penicillin amidase [Chitinophaga skermanii]
MRLVPVIISAILTLALVYALNRSWGSVPAIGRFFSPQHGFWQNAVNQEEDQNIDIPLKGLQGKATVWLDDRMVPHIYADVERDAYYVQGYMHARDRMWQMELQAFASAGRLSEVLGDRMLNYDRMKRREGMIYAAEQSLLEMERDPAMKSELDAYTAGFNEYLQNLSPRDYPVEYKLLGYQPEPWTNLKTALLLKYMSADLAGTAFDLEYTNALQIFNWDDFNKMYPDFTDTLDPIIPKGTAYAKATANAIAPPDSVLKQNAVAMHFKEERPDPDNGSNNWAVSGSKTKSGAPIICNDPHLGLSLPSLWYEVQITTKDMNVYGVSLPGAPGVIIGFNDHMGWAVTNGMEDVKDYYRLEFKEGTRSYKFNGAYREATLRIEPIKIKGKPTYYDTVSYSVWGPVIFDNTFPDNIAKQGYIAMRWKAHDQSNELLTFNRLNHAKNYDDYLNALKVYSCPAQNFIYAGKDGDIAIWHNGQYPLRWQNQGKYIMPGSDSTYAWQGYIPREEVPHIKNPARGFVSSANQHPTDATYPYHMIADYDLFRGMRINQQLAGMDHITIEDMMQLQNDNKNLFATTAMPLIKKYLDTTKFSATQLKYWQQLSAWDQYNTAESTGSTLFQLTWDKLEDAIWDDDLNRKDTVLKRPQSKTTLLWLLKEPEMKFVDNKFTPEKETLSKLLQQAFDSTVAIAQKVDTGNGLAWGRFRGTDIRHLTRALPAFSRMHLNTGGGANIVNATKQTHGPSWKMVVQLGEKTEAFGIYPGGQSGNPGSKYYDNSVNDWVDGRYNQLLVIDARQSTQPDMKFKINFIPSK